MEKSPVHSGPGWNGTLCIFFAVTVTSLFILCLFLLEGEKKTERESNGEKKCMEFRFILVRISDFCPKGFLVDFDDQYGKLEVFKILYKKYVDLIGQKPREHFLKILKIQTHLLVGFLCLNIPPIPVKNP